MTTTDRFLITGRRALVTGGSKGIGAAIARVFAEAGADVAIVGRDKKGLANVAEAIRKTGRACFPIEADFSTTEGPQYAAEQALSHFGTVDILVNNAGITHVEPLQEISIEHWDEIQAVNMRAPFILSKLLAPKMVEQRRGKIINVSSQAGVVALDGHAAYAASKGGLNMLTKVMAAELGPHNIQCNAVAPTVILTEMGEKVWGNPAKGDPMKAKIPLRRFGQPVEVADLVLYLASPASDLVTGQVILIDGGYTVI
ncbi:MAG: glucose 1-dehydrogenase [Deltaproteobacteria bacterium]|nr:glucose 1-dehydrogenase [Deltaproteobacteria bacterium]